MKVIATVPDDLIEDALALVLKEAKDYAKRFDRPGWGWTFYHNGNSYWLRGIKGGLSVSLSPIARTASAQLRDEPIEVKVPGKPK